MYRAWWEGLSGGERLDWLLSRREQFWEMRRDQLRRKHPGASQHEIMALWVEQTYRDSLPPDFLAKAAASIRALDSLKPAPD